MAAMRDAIAKRRLDDFADEFAAQQAQGDLPPL